jgi:hypothetical protein
VIEPVLSLTSEVMLDGRRSDDQITWLQGGIGGPGGTGEEDGTRLVVIDDRGCRGGRVHLSEATCPDRYSSVTDRAENDGKIRRILLSRLMDAADERVNLAGDPEDRHLRAKGGAPTAEHGSSKATEHEKCDRGGT